MPRLSRLLIATAGLSLSLACAGGDARAQAPAPAEKPASSAPEPAAPAPAEAKPAPGTAPLEPLAKGKRVRISKLYEIKPLQMLVPPDVKLTMSGSDETLPRANLSGGPLEMEVMAPDGGFHPLADETKIYAGAKDVTIARASEDAAGYVLILKKAESPSKTVYEVYVARPALKVMCHQFQALSLAEAELAASVCLTLRPAGK
jgi:hypothetical protein